MNIDITKLLDWGLIVLSLYLVVDTLLQINHNNAYVMFIIAIKLIVAIIAGLFGMYTTFYNIY
ncbi:hypothetical protein ASU25_13435 [Lactiplantibacillus plantarum]|uniref:hypothetical protein n=1 Tax=Lactiplantibacillus plantarum TaxID=1590 RepID=UPI0006AD77F5|nr:hypothetical protein [Lactiplantibacillus plantarum]AVE82308.1 hypothetical protein C4O30_04580 [Lactiplantibacillus plantarum]KRU19105.1 hypothetical protein ASU25_13435 [Lactiplantibacillus plantarum]MCG0662350.1 hypothetical protein [Lactiplantibacillus plantarum]MCT3206267.1 hypothetical protein [Lactiplantibacillus plantarum]MCT3219815.1 hypothetical protein [Lactiplantibacillus plantarum]